MAKSAAKNHCAREKPKTVLGSCRNTVTPSHRFRNGFPYIIAQALPNCQRDVLREQGRISAGPGRLRRQGLSRPVASAPMPAPQMPRPGRWQGALPSCTQLHRTHGTAGGLPLRKAKISGSRTAWQHDRQGKLQEELQARRIISRRIIYGNETFRRGPVTPRPFGETGPAATVRAACCDKACKGGVPPCPKRA